jgi:hypothetical protein
MIKADELAEGKEIYFKNGNGVTLPALQSILKEVAGKYQIPIAFKMTKSRLAACFLPKRTAGAPPPPNELIRSKVCNRQSAAIAGTNHILGALYRGQSPRLGRLADTRIAVRMGHSHQGKARMGRG